MSALLKIFRTTAFRLSLIYAVLFAAAAGIAIGYLYWQTNILFARQLNSTIEAEIKGLAEQYSSGGLEALARVVAERSQAPGNNLYLLTNAAGRRIAGNLGSVSKELLDTQGRVQFAYRVQAGGSAEPHLAIAQVFRLAGGARLIVGRDVAERRVLENAVGSAFLWSVGLMALVGIGGGMLLSRVLLRRIDAVTTTSQAIMKGELTERIPLAGTGDEFDRLASSLNAMLDRIEQLMAGLREVSDNIAHDLKTPLTRLRNRVETALREPASVVNYREALTSTIEEADELIKTFNALLSIARLEAGALSDRFEVFDLTSAVGDVVELYEPVAETQGMSLRLAAPPQPVKVRGNRQLVAQAVANMIDNALKYARPGSEKGQAGTSSSATAIDVTVNALQGKAEIIVADHGPGIPAGERERVFRRFVRLETSRSRPGSGLGLSLVAAVAQLHEGQVRLEDNEPGLRVVLSLPAQEQRARTSQGA